MLLEFFLAICFSISSFCCLFFICIAYNQIKEENQEMKEFGNACFKGKNTILFNTKQLIVIKVVATKETWHQVN
jgi:hypothetical protein